MGVRWMRGTPHVRLAGDPSRSRERGTLPAPRIKQGAPGGAAPHTWTMTCAGLPVFDEDPPWGVGGGVLNPGILLAGGPWVLIVYPRPSTSTTISQSSARRSHCAPAKGRCISRPG
jgi:hypothetical protein